MKFDLLGDVNYLAALVATIAYFVWGAIWYAPPVLGKVWQRAAGIEMPENTTPSPMFFIGTLVAYFVGAVATAMLALGTASDTVSEGVVLGVVIGVGYAMTAAAVTTIYERKPQPTTYFWLNGIYNFVGALIVAIIVSAWQ
jgi:hypothetical protein